MTADTYSNTLGYLVMGTGNDNNSWGANANGSVFQVFEDAIANMLVSSVSGGTLDLSGSPPPAGPSQVRYAALVFNGVLASNQIITVPNLQKSWLVKNATSGAFTLKMKTTSGSASTAIPQNSGWQRVTCDGSNNVSIEPFNSNQVQMPDGSVSAPVYSFVNNPSSGFYRAGTQDIRLSINGADVLQITGAGAGTPNIFNILSPLSFQLGGSQIVPSGSEMQYAGIELPGGGWLWEDGTAYSRATYANLFSALSKTCTGNTHTSTTIDGLSVDLRSKGLKGAYVEGTGIQLGTTILSIAAASVTLSQATTSTSAGVTLRIIPFGQGDGSTTFNVPDRRDRTLIGRADMNGTDAGRLTVNDATKLNLSGGEESHTLTAFESAGLTYTSAVNDPGHSHVEQAGNSSVGASFVSALSTVAGGETSSHTSNALTSITVSTSSNAGGGAHNNMQPFGVTNFIVKI